MSNKSRSAPPPIVFILLAALGIFGWVKFQPFKGDTNTARDTAPIALPKSESSLLKRFSLGEKMLVAANATAAKQDGIAAYSKQDYVRAADYFQQSLAEYPNDPETSIYLNNARVAEQQQLKIAAVVPHWQ